MANENPDVSGAEVTAPRKLEMLAALVSTLPHQLAALPAEEAANKPAPGKWSNKEELGHLIDSAANNHQRIVRAQLQNGLAMPDYNGDAWVALHGYQQRLWRELIELWRAANEQMLAAARAVPESTWSHTLTIGDSGPLSLSFVFDDYVGHMVSHLSHIGINVEKIVAGGAETLYPEKPAEAAHPIDPLMARRWSPRLFEEGRAVEPEKILSLLEAARWAPSCFNEQPWRYLVFDGSNQEALERARDCLVEGNAWARKAPVLMISVAREAFTYNQKPNRTAHHDVGLASENLVLQATRLGLAAHQMAGFDLERARAEFKIPEGYTPIAMIAIGYPYRGQIDELPDATRERELAPRTRRPLSELAFSGEWGVGQI